MGVKPGSCLCTEPGTSVMEVGGPRFQHFRHGMLPDNTFMNPLWSYEDTEFLLLHCLGDQVHSLQCSILVQSPCLLLGPRSELPEKLCGVSRVPLPRILVWWLPVSEPQEWATHFTQGWGQRETPRWWSLPWESPLSQGKIAAGIGSYTEHAQS